MLIRTCQRRLSCWRNESSTSSSDLYELCASAFREGVRPDVSVVSGDGSGDRGGGVMEMRVEQN